MNYLDRAREGRGSGGYYLLGLLVILFLWLIGGSIVAVALGALLTGNAEGTGATAWQRLLIDFLPFALLGGGVLLAVRAVLGRPARSVVTGRPRVSVGRLLVGAAAWAGIALVGIGIDALVHRDAYRVTFDWERFWPVLIVVLLLVPVQAGSEELLFRGYVVQWTSLATRATWVLAAVSGLAFAIPHLANPEAQGAQWYAWLVWFAYGAGWAWASIRDGRIELAIGAHVANNLVGILVVGYSRSVVPTEAVWTTDLLDWPLAIVISALSAVAFVVITARRRTRS